MGSYENVEMIFTYPIKVFLPSVQNDRYTEYGEGRKKTNKKIKYNL